MTRSKEKEKKEKTNTSGGEASQFFQGKDVESQNAPLQVTSEKVIDLLNQAQLASAESKLESLKQVQELIINKDPALLDNFLDEILIFQQDRSADVRRFVVTFIEEACKKDPDLLPQTVGCLAYMLGDENIVISKRVMLACNSLYKVALQIVCKLRTIKDDIRAMWDTMTEMKRNICGMIESDNDGVRTHAIKFMEMLILVHSLKPKDADMAAMSSNKKDSKREEISIDIVPPNHPFVKQEELVSEGMTTLEALLALCASASISSVNLMAVLSSLTSIGKQRPAFVSTVIKAFESLHANLPPTLSKSQVSSIRKNLKMQLFLLLKLPLIEQYQTQIGTLLTDLGATSSEIQKSMPKIDARKRRMGEEAALQKTKPESPAAQFSLSKAIELTTADIVPKLSKESVTDLVLVSMLFLPRSMPSHFQETFTPIAAAGSPAQAEHLARLMATQMTNAGIGVGVETAKEIAAAEAIAEAEAKKKEQKEPKSIPVVGSSSTPNPDGEKPEKNMQAKYKELTGKQPRSITDIAAELKSGSKTSQTASTRLRKIKQFKLGEVTRELGADERKSMLLSSYARILRSDKQALVSGYSTERHKVIVGLAMQFYGQLTDALIKFVMEDFRTRIDLGILWLYQQYVKEEGQRPGCTIESDSQYAMCLKKILNGMKETLEPRDKLFTKFLLEAPVLSDGVRRIIKEYCMDPSRVMVGFSTLRELISRTPAKCQEWLQLLLELTTAEIEQVRVQAIHSAKKLHSRPEFTEQVEDFALHSLRQLLQPTPPMKDIDPNEIQNDDILEWTEESMKAYLYLYLALLPTNHTLFLNLADVYVDSSPLIKRAILRHLEHPVRAIGMNSPELLRLVENCPGGAETLVTRVLHIVTDKNPPTVELVQKVKDLYNKRVSDVRFLIPVLNGLTKAEIIDVLPKLISQTPNVVKEVFNRLLGSFQSESTVAINPPLSPSELLVSLHTIEAKSDVKAIMKAINICFGEKEIYTQEVLAVVIQQLMDVVPLPTLFMRTVIQSLGMCPRLVGFVMNILNKLIVKQVWIYPKVWQGFIKCCQMTKPQSLPVMLQLPHIQLEEILQASPDIKGDLFKHVSTLTPNQRGHIPAQLMKLIEGDAPADASPQEELPPVVDSDKRKRKIDVSKVLGKDKKKKEK